MGIPQTLEFDIVTMALTRGKRNLIVVLLFIGFLAMAALMVIVFQSKIIALIFFIPFVFIVMLISNKTLKLKRLGLVSMLHDKIALVNEIQHLKRNIPVTEIDKIFIRGGLESNQLRGESAIKERSTLFLDFTLKTKEEVVVHIRVPEDDEETSDQITEYCKALNIKCQRKL